jgi:cytochrome c556
MLMPAGRLFWIFPLAASCAAASSQASAPSAPSPTSPTTGQLVAARQAGMHMAATLYYRGVKEGVKNGVDVQSLVHEPEGIALWAAAIPGLFPPGSAAADSRAKPEIWSNQADFAAKASNLERAAKRLAELGRAGDTTGFVAQAPQIEAACAACHAAYRSD